MFRTCKGIKVVVLLSASGLLLIIEAFPHRIDELGFNEQDFYFFICLSVLTDSDTWSIRPPRLGSSAPAGLQMGREELFRMKE